VTSFDPDTVLERLSLEEKASLVLGSDFWHTAAVPRLGVPAVMMSDGPHGLRAQPGHGDHVGIGGSVPATCFPTASALASSWDPGLLAEIGAALGREARHQGVSVLLGPGINMKRSPLCGRNFEYFSEDPYLAGELAAAMVAGLQGQGVGASVKHFAVNNQEADRLRVSAEVDERTLREIYLPAFERVITAARPWTVMCAYNKVNGTYAAEHHWLLTEVLRGEWGFEGLVVSDWGAVHDRVAALRAGLDLEMPPSLGRGDRAVVNAVISGELDPEILDVCVRRVLRLAQQAGQHQGQPDSAASAAEEEEHHALARRAAAASAVLLKNDGPALPLLLPAGARLAVIGPFARAPRFQGAGSSQVNPTRVDIPLDELRTALPAVTVDYAPGFSLDHGEPDAGLIGQARSVAAGADAIVVFLGLPDAEESEGFDRGTIDLPAGQVQALQAVSGLGGPVVVVLANGSVVSLAPWEHHAHAVLECWLGGQAAGGAVADLLTGAAAPAGKLAETIPLRLQDNPSYLGFPGDSHVVRYGEGLFIGYRGYDARNQEVARPFGFGLSYTTFEISRPAVSVRGSVAGGDLAVDVTVTVTNTGGRRGAEVVQVYVEDPQSTVSRPVRELRGFARAELDPGESRQVTVRLTQRAFAFWSELWRRWAVEAGEFVLHIGTSSRDLPHRVGISLAAPSLGAPLTRDSTLTEWLADGEGAALLSGALHRAAGDAGVLADTGLVRVVGTMPLSTLANFGFPGLTHDLVDEVAGQLKR